MYIYMYILLHVPLTLALSRLSLTKERQVVKTRTQLYFQENDYNLATRLLREKSRADLNIPTSP